MKLMISYARRRNDKFVYELAGKLHNTPGYNAWIDRSQIVGGADWWAEICSAVEDAECVVVILTPRYLESIYCMAELDYALALNKPILPLMLEALDTFPPQISATQIDDIEQLSLTDVLLRCFPALNGILQNIYEGRHQLPNPRPARPDVPKPPPPPTRSAPDLFDAALEAFDQGNTGAAGNLLRELQRAHPHDRLSHDAADMLANIQLEETRAVEYERMANRLQSARTTLARQGAERLKAAFIDQYGAEYDPLRILGALSEQRSLVEPAPPRIEFFSSPTTASINIAATPPERLEWVQIPAGRVTLESGGYIPSDPTSFDVPAFAIAKYPVTNAQFAIFVQEGGYHTERWWTEAGWQEKQLEGWTEPRYWQDERFDGAEQPVVGVSWYEAVAFCMWLNAALPSALTPSSGLRGGVFRLPTEQQWQRAAQGDDGRVYPWGDDWDCRCCNNSVAPCKSDRPTPVHQYARKGASPFAVVDMVGNTWEWCLTGYNFGKADVQITDSRVLRGGSFTSPLGDLRVTRRDRSDPGYADFTFGFRIALA